MAKKIYFRHISSVFNNLFTQFDLSKNIKQQKALKLWPKIVGPEISSVSWPLEFKGKKLRVLVSDPIWMQQLTFFESIIIEKMNSELTTTGNNLIDKIYFQLGVLPKTKESNLLKDKRGEAALSPEESNLIDDTVKNLSDPELKETLKSLFREAVLARKREEKK